MPNMWMVRAGSGGENVEEFVKHGLIAFGDTRLGALSPDVRKDDLLRLFAEKYPEEKEGSRASWASQLMRMLQEMKIGDLVVTSDRDRRLYLLGSITSEYEWAPQLIADKPHIRRVQWTHQVPRDALTINTKNSLGSSLTIFRIGPEVAKELQAKQVPIGAQIAEVPPQPEIAAEEEVAKAEVRAETLEKADEFIEDAINRLDWLQMQDLVAGILRAMGYRTNVSPPGADRGVDIFASPDGLGLQEPRIFVEVKHRNQTKIGPELIRSFLGGRRPGDKCLYVSTSSFTKEARYEAERASVPITLLDLQDLRKLLVENYENLDAETRALVPLKRLYWPLG